MRSSAKTTARRRRAKNTTNKLPKISEIIAGSKLDRLDAELFLREILNFSPTQLFANPELEITENDFSRFGEFEKLRLAGKSVAAILGRREFFGLDFFVDENVLIPRPETEILVAEILRIAPRNLLDVGTGSGAIAITVKKNLPKCEICASDISRNALVVARKNAENLGAKIEFVESDLLAGVAGNFEIIVANLPYIPKNSAEIESGVREFEPACALFSGADGLDLIRELLGEIANLSKKPKIILLEFGGAEQKTPLANFAREKFPDSKIEFLPDFAGIDRVLKLKM